MGQGSDISVPILGGVVSAEETTMKWEGACWEYTGAITEKGYGRISIGPRGANKRTYTHRLVYEALVGPIPEGMTLDHLCKNKSCYNPAHLEIVTRAENSRRGARKDRCLRGHDDWVRRTDRGPNDRECRSCRKIRSDINNAKRGA